MKMAPDTRQPTNKRITVGVIGDALGASFPSHLGFVHAAEAEDANLVIFSGRLWAPPGETEPARNIVFDLAGPENVDGLFIDSDHLGHYAGINKIRSYCKHRWAIPVVNNGPRLAGVPHFAVGHYQGMYKVVSHLIESHQLTRIAFIRGPTQSGPMNQRFEGYKDALRDHGLRFEERLVAPAAFMSRLEKEGVDVLIEDRRLRPGVDFEAVVGTNDGMAIEALAALRRYGVALPGDVAIAGFDDALEALVTSPSLTTAYLPRYEMGTWAVSTLSAMLSGAPVPMTASFPATLLIRESCGCQPAPLTEAAAGLVPQEALETPVRAALLRRRSEVCDKLTQIGAALKGVGADHNLDVLYDALVSEICQPAERQEASPFLRMLSRLVKYPTCTPRSTGVWHTIISTLRCQVLPLVADESSQAKAARSRLEDLCQQARVLIGEAALHAQIQHETVASGVNSKLLELYDQMGMAGSVDELMATLAERLPSLGVPSCYLSAFAEPSDPLSTAKLLLAYDRSGRMAVEPTKASFPTRQLLPHGIIDPQDRHTLIVYPLFDHRQQWGFVLFELGPTYGLLYEALREHISSALKRIQSQQETEQARHAAEEANRLKSRFLATVSHELRTPLDIINSLSDSLLSQNSSGSLPEVHQHELEVIHTTSEHLKRMVLDVIDLGRSQLGQLMLEREPVDVTELLADVTPLGKRLAEERGLSWEVTLGADLPPLWGDRARLRQVLINLLSNACKFTSQGSVSLNVSADAAAVTFTVSDTGLGIPPKEQATIFDEFSQSERTAARGYGGMGLGLAISRNLVELHGGTLGVQSSGLEGAGATFSFTIPVASAAKTTIRETVDDSAWEDAILIVSGKDNRGSPHPLLDQLRGQGLKAVVLYDDDPAHCFERIKASPPRAIVLDCELSARWSVDLATRLKGDTATRLVPVLFYRLLPRDQGALLELDYCPKPIRSDELAQILSQRGLLNGEPPACPPTILIVDDEATVLELHRQRLRQVLPDCRVILAQNGRQALEIMSRQQPDLVLLDLLMPEMDGFGVLDAMRDRETTRDIPVIVLTAQTLSEEIVERLNKGVNGILTKGVFSVDETVAQIRAALCRENGHRATARQVAERAMVYLHEHYDESISRDDLAQYTGVSARYMTQCFRSELGLTPTDYLNRYRVEQAKRLLQEDVHSITDIALAVGYNSSAYFSRVFRSEVGMSPREFRDGARSANFAP